MSPIDPRVLGSPGLPPEADVYRRLAELEARCAKIERGSGRTLYYAEALGATVVTSGAYADAPDGLGPSLTIPKPAPQALISVFVAARQTAVAGGATDASVAVDYGAVFKRKVLGFVGDPVGGLTRVSQQGSSTGVIYNGTGASAAAPGGMVVLNESWPPGASGETQTIKLQYVVGPSGSTTFTERKLWVFVQP